MTTNPITPEVLARLRALHAAATDREATARSRDVAQRKLSDMLTWNGHDGGDGDMPALLDEVERLRQTSADYCETCGWSTRFPDGCVNCEVAKLRASIRHAADQLAVAEEKEGDTPAAAAGHFREALRTIARELPKSDVKFDRSAVWGELREMDALHNENANLRASLAAAMEFARHAEGCSAVFNTQDSSVCYPCKCGWSEVRRGIEA